MHNHPAYHLIIGTDHHFFFKFYRDVFQKIHFKRAKINNPHFGSNPKLNFSKRIHSSSFRFKTLEITQKSNQDCNFLKVNSLN